MEFLPIERMLLSSAVITITVALLIHLPISKSYPTFEVPRSNSEIPQELYNLVVEPASGALFVGGLNRLYKLPPDLGEADRIELETGPRPDNQACPVPPRKCGEDVVREDTDNINKILVLDDDRLITCGSIYQGTCQVRSLENLVMLANSTSQEIVPNTVNGTVVAFVTPASTAGGKVLFVGTSKGRWRDIDGVPIISSRELPRNLSQKNLLEIVKGEEGIGTRSKLLFPPEEANSPASAFKIEYIYGFSVDHFSYFIANQPKVSYYFGIPENYTKIVQICQNDISYYSYIELPLNCKNPATAEKYNLAQAAHVTKIGSSWGLTGFEDFEDVLFVTFSKARPDTMEPSEDSAVCMYPIRLIKELFFNRRLECISGGTEKTDIMWWEPENCPKSPGSRLLIDIMNDQGPGYCHNIDFKWPMGGNTGYDGDAVYMDSSGITAIATTHYENDTVIFLGDSNGHLKMLRVQSASLASVYQEKTIDEGSPVVREGLKFSTDEEFLYVMTQRKITKVPIADCNQYSECGEHLNVTDGIGDPYCGWCLLQPSNECDSNPCQNGGTCRDFDGGYNCTCETEWQGRNCDTDINECLKCLNYPCQNGGTCLNSDGGYNCKCGKQWQGRHCETDINECHRNPCQNDGRCVNYEGGYLCDCKTGTYGENCEKAF